ncbi:MAG TPA: ABC transporter permease [Phycisphaerales bacterium]|nr:ABC transporter permease [Phycisphaerales bacterium]HRQ76525.1 ABC transporter permease [Phycisphaerales bacterium]
MYQALLTNRYLTTRVIPLIAVAAVALCVALVIIVVSVMTGFLNMVKSSGRVLMGDVVIQYPVQGIPHFELVIEELERLPEVAAATPVVDSWGLLKMPYPEGPNKDTRYVQIWGIEPESFARVTGYADTLYWRPLKENQRASEHDLRRLMTDQLVEDAMSLRDHRTGRPAIVMGMHVSEGNQRQRDGSYHPLGDGYWWMPQYEVTLTTLPVDTGGDLGLQPESFIFPIVNEFVSGVFVIDNTRVMIPFNVAQRMFHLDEAERVDEQLNPVGVFPGRATIILVRAADGVTPDRLRDMVATAYNDLVVRSRSGDPAFHVPLQREGFGLSIRTWEQQQAQFIGPVEKERELMRVLFSIIYLVCAGLVLTIFWAIVHEKTRDIGILRSVGASRFGIAAIFLRYGAVIGAIGAVFGLGLAWLVVNNINAIHDAVGEDAPRWTWIAAFILAGGALMMAVFEMMRDRMLRLVLWALGTIVLALLGIGLYFHRGTLLWDPSVYYFSKIPNVIDFNTAITTMIGAVIFSVIGAFVPAAKAADTDPVNALRYE